MYGSSDATLLRFWRREDFPEAWLLCATSSTKVCKPTFWGTETIFSKWTDVRAKACAEFVARCIRIGKSCNSGSRVVTVSDSQLLGQNTHIVRQCRIEYEPDQQHVSPLLEATFSMETSITNMLIWGMFMSSWKN